MTWQTSGEGSYHSMHGLCCSKSPIQNIAHPAHDGLCLSAREATSLRNVSGRVRHAPSRLSDHEPDRGYRGAFRKDEMWAEHASGLMGVTGCPRRDEMWCVIGALLPLISHDCLPHAPRSHHGLPLGYCTVPTPRWLNMRSSCAGGGGRGGAYQYRAMQVTR